MTSAVRRRKYVRNIQRLRCTEGCLTDCVAFMLNLHPQNVPYFVYPRKGWSKRLKSFFLRRGWKVWWVPCSRVPSKGVHLLCGDSLVWKISCHCVVYRTGKLLFDPQFPSKWSDKRVTHRLVMERTNYTDASRVTVVEEKVG